MGKSLTVSGLKWMGGSVSFIGGCGIVRMQVLVGPHVPTLARKEGEQIALVHIQAFNKKNRRSHKTGNKI